MARKKTENLDEEVFETEEKEEVFEEVSTIDDLGFLEINVTPKKVADEINELLTPKKEYRVLYILGSSVFLSRKEDGKTIGKTIPKQNNIKVGDILKI